ncbi:unnamed protein product [Boreogadus saida]
MRECQWKKTSTPKVTLPVSELYPQVEDTYNPLARDISMEDVAWFSPYSQRNSTIAEAVEVPSFCLFVEEQGYALEKTHAYWHQVQGQLHLTDRDLSYFVVWTTKEALVIPIPKDPAWGQHLVVLEEFYRQHILPVLISRED